MKCFYLHKAGLCVRVEAASLADAKEFCRKYVTVNRDCCKKDHFWLRQDGPNSFLGVLTDEEIADDANWKEGDECAVKSPQAFKKG